MTGHTELNRIADRLERLATDRRDPEAFHIEKNELTREIRQFAESLTRAHSGSCRIGGSND